MADFDALDKFSITLGKEMEDIECGAIYSWWITYHITHN
jgi:hypothetical protein